MLTSDLKPNTTDVSLHSYTHLEVKVTIHLVIVMGVNGQFEITVRAFLSFIKPGTCNCEILQKMLTVRVNTNNSNPLKY